LLDLDKVVETINMYMRYGDYIENGRVVDEEVAKSTPCKCYKTKKGTLLCWSPGVIGTLNKRQIEIYCKEGKSIKEAPEALEQRLEIMAKASKKCAIGNVVEIEGKKMEIKNIADRLECLKYFIEKEKEKQE